jgi:hypothetical protein
MDPDSSGFAVGFGFVAAAALSFFAAALAALASSACLFLACFSSSALAFLAAASASLAFLAASASAFLVALSFEGIARRTAAPTHPQKSTFRRVKRSQVKSSQLLAKIALVSGVYTGVQYK